MFKNKEANQDVKKMIAFKEEEFSVKFKNPDLIKHTIIVNSDLDMDWITALRQDKKILILDADEIERKFLTKETLYYVRMNKIKIVAFCWIQSKSVEKMIKYLISEGFHTGDFIFFLGTVETISTRMNMQYFMIDAASLKKCRDFVIFTKNEYLKNNVIYSYSLYRRMIRFVRITEKPEELINLLMCDPKSWLEAFSDMQATHDEMWNFEEYTEDELKEMESTMNERVRLSRMDKDITEGSPKVSPNSEKKRNSNSPSLRTKSKEQYAEDKIDEVNRNRKSDEPKLVLRRIPSKERN